MKSTILLVLLGGLLQAGTIAYDVPAGQPGNQSFPGTQGLDFDVLSPILVTHLGVFDSNGDGILGTAGLHAQIYDRSTQLAVSADLLFTSGAPGTLINGSRFLQLSVPLLLAVGQYSIVGWGNSSLDLSGNAGCVGLFIGGCQGANAFSPSTMNSGGGLIQFVGVGRNNPFQTAGGYPTFLDGGPANRYLAATFQFDAPTAAPEPGTLVVAGAALAILGLLRRR